MNTGSSDRVKLRRLVEKACHFRRTEPRDGDAIFRVERAIDNLRRRMYPRDVERLLAKRAA